VRCGGVRGGGVWVGGARGECRVAERRAGVMGGGVRGEDRQSEGRESRAAE
jgi:hypothetical protein